MPATANMPVDLDSFPDTRTGNWNPLPLAKIQRGLAFHEAAHAVVGMTLGMSLSRTRVHLIDHHGLPGWTGATTWNVSFVREFDFAVECAAGEIADLKQLTEAGDATADAVAFTAAPHDRDLAVNALASVGYTIVVDSGPAPECGATWREVTAVARQKVDQYWQQITAVALAMLAAPGYELSGAAVSAVAGIPNPNQES